MDYKSFLKTKQFVNTYKGIDINDDEINDMLFDYQKKIVKVAISKKKYGVFLDTGLGKTFILLEYARILNKLLGYKVLIISPLAVLYQTINEAKKLDIVVNNLRENEVSEINIINYEKIDKIDYDYSVVILDESSILKSYSGVYKKTLIDKFRVVEYKMVLSATPSPNDNDEMGNQCEFLGIMKSREMLSTYFINDLGDTGKWRLKRHAEESYFDFLSEWAVFIQNPANLGFDYKYKLPLLNINECEVSTDKESDGFLFKLKSESLDEIRSNRKVTLIEKCNYIKELVEKTNEKFLIWCFYNDESELLHKIIKDSIEVKGSDEEEHKSKSIIDFANGKIKVLITKPKIAGFGINWQVCHNMVFVGTNNSYEQYYQAIRRCYRFGQKKDVNVYLVYSDLEHSILKHIEYKEKMNTSQKQEMEKRTMDGFLKNIRNQDNHINHKIIIPKYLHTKLED